MSHFLETLGLRDDGRKPNELRKISIELDVVKKANGSCKFRIGNTIILCSIFGPKQSIRKYKECELNVKINTCQFSSSIHLSSTQNRKFDKLLSKLILKTFNSLIINKYYLGCCIDIIIEIIQNDGNIKSNVINCVTLSLINAGIALNDYCVSCNVGYLNGKNIPFIDLNKNETYNINTNKYLKTFQLSSKPLNANYYKKKDDKENKDKNNIQINNDTYFSGNLLIAMLPTTNKIITIEMESIIDVNKMEKLLKASQKAIHKIHKIMKKSVKDYSMKMLQLKGIKNY